MSCLPPGLGEGVATALVALSFNISLIGAMGIAGFAGTAVGSRLLTRIPGKVFRLAFRIPLTLAASSLIRRALA